MTRWFVTGAAGAVGSDLSSLLSATGAEVIAADRSALDIADADGVAAALSAARPDTVINPAAYTRVDDAESDEAAATRVNGDGAGALARWCADNDVRLIHLSTDYVFSGDATAPYETDDDPAPLSAYGRSKLAGERQVLAADGDCHVVRTAWLYGTTGTNFIRTIGTRLLQGQPVSVVDDQRGAPTWTRQLAAALIALGEAEVGPGMWHCSAGGDATWYDVAVAIGEELGTDPALVTPTTSAEFVRPAPRPQYSVLSNAKWAAAGLPSLPHWRTGLRDALSDPTLLATLQAQ